MTEKSNFEKKSGDTTIDVSVDELFWRKVNKKGGDGPAPLFMVAESSHSDVWTVLFQENTKK